MALGKSGEDLDIRGITLLGLPSRGSPILSKRITCSCLGELTLNFSPASRKIFSSERVRSCSISSDMVFRSGRSRRTPLLSIAASTSTRGISTVSRQVLHVQRDDLTRKLLHKVHHGIGAPAGVGPHLLDGKAGNDTAFARFRRPP